MKYLIPFIAFVLVGCATVSQKTAFNGRLTVETPVPKSQLTAQKSLTLRMVATQSEFLRFIPSILNQLKNDLPQQTQFTETLVSDRDLASNVEGLVLVIEPKDWKDKGFVVLGNEGLTMDVKLLQYPHKTLLAKSTILAAIDRDSTTVSRGALGMKETDKTPIEELIASRTAKFVVEFLTE